MTQELEQQLSQANQQRTRAEKLTDDYRAGLGTEQQRVSLLIVELQQHLKNAEETKAFKQLINLVDALKVTVDTQSKVEQLLQTQLTAKDLADLTALFQQINSSLAAIKGEVSMFNKAKSANADLERQVLNLIKTELEK